MSNKKDKNMSQIKQALIEAKEIADEFQNTHSDDCFARAHYSCQSWILDKMIRITNKNKELVKMFLPFYKLFAAMFTYYLILEGLKKTGLIKSK